jgi:hypothetical protein
MSRIQFLECCVVEAEAEEEEEGKPHKRKRNSTGTPSKARREHVCDQQAMFSTFE